MDSISIKTQTVWSFGERNVVSNRLPDEFPKSGYTYTSVVSNAEGVNVDHIRCIYQFSSNSVDQILSVFTPEDTFLEQFKIRGSNLVDKITRWYNNLDDDEKSKLVEASNSIENVASPNDPDLQRVLNYFLLLVANTLCAYSLLSRDDLCEIGNPFKPFDISDFSDQDPLSLLTTNMYRWVLPFITIYNSIGTSSIGKNLCNQINELFTNFNTVFVPGNYINLDKAVYNANLGFVKQCGSMVEDFETKIQEYCEGPQEIAQNFKVQTNLALDELSLRIEDYENRTYICLEELQRKAHETMTNLQTGTCNSVQEITESATTSTQELMNIRDDSVSEVKHLCDEVCCTRDDTFKELSDLSERVISLIEEKAFSENKNIDEHCLLFHEQVNRKQDDNIKTLESKIKELQTNFEQFKKELGQLTRDHDRKCTAFNVQLQANIDSCDYRMRTSHKDYCDKINSACIDVQRVSDKGREVRTYLHKLIPSIVHQVRKEVNCKLEKDIRNACREIESCKKHTIHDIEQISSQVLTLLKNCEEYDTFDTSSYTE